MAGRVLSKKNESALRAALEQIGAVLAELDETDTETDAGTAGEPEADADGETAKEAGDLAGEFVPLTEAAVRQDGTVRLKLIAPGWGSSGYYPPDVLRRDGPQVFAKGTKGFWDHPTATEEAERPEGTLDRLASELLSDAQWQDNGPAGPGLYADAKVFKPYQEAVNELAPHIGVSIRAAGRTRQGEAEGRKGPIVEQLVAARSVDWVTVPGAGGRVVEMFEAARPRAAAPVTTSNEQQGGQMAVDQEFETKLAERLAALEAENGRLREAMILRDARDAVREALGGASVPDVTKARLLGALSSNPPVVDGALDRTALLTRVSEAVSAEQAYLAEAAGYGSGRIVGMGGGQVAEPVKPEDQAAAMREAFGALGLSEQEAEIAARGRGRW